MTDEIVVSTDGSALGNPNGPMGWAWADHAKNAGGTPGHAHDEHGYDAGGATNGTNQIGELCAVLEALRAHPGPEPLLIESDSQYAINCSTTWVRGWKKNGWRNSSKQPVKNVEIIKAIDEEMSRRPGPVRFKWVKGHAGNAGNELVDELARTYAGDCRSGTRDGYLPIEGWRSLLASDYARGLDVPPDVRLVLKGEAPADSLRRPEPPHPSEGTTPDGVSAGSQPSLAELLAEPEGVPDYGPVLPTVPLQEKEKATEDEPTRAMPHEQEPAAKTDHCDHSERSGHSRGHSEESDHPSAAASGSQTATMPAVSQPASTPPVSVPSAPAPSAPTFKPSGLTVSGTVTFSPAPSTSPYFTGEPMHVTGVIAVDGYVDGDGTLHLTNAQFCRG